MKTGNNALFDSEGYSLVEMMVTLAVFSLLLITAWQVFDASQESMNWNYHQLNLQKEMRRILDTMSKEIRESSPSSPTPISIGANTITFQIPATVSATGAVTAWTPVTYGLGADNTVVRTTGTQTNAIGGGGITGLNFVYPVAGMPRTVQIQITGTATTLKLRNITTTATGQVVLRNP